MYRMYSVWAERREGASGWRGAGWHVLSRVESRYYLNLN